MSIKKKSLKDQIDFYEYFKEQYFKIIDELNFDHQKDCEARDFLSNILKVNRGNFSYDLNNILCSFKENIRSNENIFVYGCGPSLVPTIEWIIGRYGYKFFISPLNIVADGAAIYLKEKKIPIHTIFTDLDGITKQEFNLTKYMVIHSHGDNIDKLEIFKQEIIEFKNIIGTTQVKPLDNIINSGGFTDGDRILYFLRSLLAPKNKIFFIGMDFGNVIGKYSKPHLTDNIEGAPIKLKKLQIAVQLIEQLLPEIQNELYFVNSYPISDKFQYLSLEDLKLII